MDFAIIDWIFAIIIVIFALAGIIKGFINNIFGKLAWILGIIFACLFYDDVAAKLMDKIGNAVLTNVVSFLLVFVVIFLLIKILQMIVAKIFQFSILKSLDRTLGFFFGIIEGLAVVGLLIFVLSVQPFFSIENLFTGSFFYSLMQTLMVKSKEIQINV